MTAREVVQLFCALMVCGLGVGLLWSIVGRE